MRPFPKLSAMPLGDAPFLNGGQLPKSLTPEEAAFVARQSNGAHSLLRKTKFPDLASHYKAQGPPPLRHQEANLSQKGRNVSQENSQHIIPEETERNAGHIHKQ